MILETVHLEICIVCGQKVFVFETQFFFNFEISVQIKNLKFCSKSDISEFIVYVWR